MSSDRTGKHCCCGYLRVPVAKLLMLLLLPLLPLVQPKYYFNLNFLLMVGKS